MRALRSLAAALLTLPALALQAGEWRGYVAGEWLGFVEDPAFSGQHDSYLSLAAEPEYFHLWNDRDDLFTFKPYLLLDQHDSARTHADIRELAWDHAAYDWELRAGISKVFWGVTESVHLVDIINQTDLVVNPDGEDKLGQPMVKLTLIREAGVFDLFLLPGFRERTFPGRQGRPRFAIPIDTHGPRYESGAGQWHTDAALRWSDTFGAFDIGIAHFYGTGREPSFFIKPAAIDPATLSISKVTPYYQIINQTSLDLQAIYGSWLWKLEAFTRSGQGKRINAAAGGFEYTFVGVRDTQLDVGVIAEYLYDSREEILDAAELLRGAPVTVSSFQDDLVLGMRLTLNDVAGSELLASVDLDLEGGGQSYNLEASRRLGNDWKLSIEARGVSNVPEGSVQYSYRDDTRLRMELARYF